MSTNKSIKLARGGDSFRVLVVKNNTHYKPGETLDKTTVDDLIERGDWDVTVVELRDESATAVGRK